MTLSQKLWQFIRSSLPHTQLYRVLMLQTPPRLKRKLPVALLIAAVMLYIYMPYLMLPLTVHYFGMQLAMKIAHALAEQRESGRYDLLSIVPSIGDFGLLREIARLYYYDTEDRLTQTFEYIAVLIGISVIWFICTSAEQLIGRMFALILIGLFLFADYRQSFVAAMIIGMVTGMKGNRERARAAAMGGYLTLQLGSYVLLTFLLLLFLTVANSLPTMLGLLMLVATPASFYFVREYAIFAMWRWLHRNLNDIPSLKPSIKRG